MRDVFVDLSNNNRHGLIFGGYAGEHNQTKLTVKLPDDLIGDNYSYEWEFGTAYNTKYTEEVTFIESNNLLSCMLTSDVTVKGVLEVQIIAYSITNNNSNEIVRTFIGKSEIISLLIKNSVSGNPQDSNKTDIPASAIDALKIEFEKKADTDYVDTELEKKADMDYVNEKIYPTNISVAINESDLIVDFMLGATKKQCNTTIPPFESIPVWQEGETEKDFYMTFGKTNGEWSFGVSYIKGDYSFCVLHVAKTNSGSEITGYELLTDSYIFNELSKTQRKLLDGLNYYVQVDTAYVYPYDYVNPEDYYIQINYRTSDGFKYIEAPIGNYFEDKDRGKDISFTLCYTKTESNPEWHFTTDASFSDDPPIEYVVECGSIHCKYYEGDNTWHTECFDRYGLYKKADKPDIKGIIPSVLASNTEYYLGNVSADTTLAFPSSASQGDCIYINFNCSAEFALTIDTTYTSDIDIDLEEGVGYEIFATFNGSIWILGYNEYTVS